jgi:Methyltransferase domain/Putative zinc binding domain
MRGTGGAPVRNAWMSRDQHDSTRRSARQAGALPNNGLEQSEPPCDSLLTAEMLDKPEKTYPLRLMHCPDSGLAQLDYVVDGIEIYYPDYPYRSGISWPLEHYQRAFADRIVARFAIAPGALCVDIGSNDGTLLTGFKRHGCRALGVEPTNIARIAREENGVETIQQFFTESLARDMRRDYGPAQVITMTNVFAHMAPLGEVMRGLLQLLDRNGVFVTESHYLLDVLEKNQFDTIYHEHIRTYSLKSLVLLFAYYGLEVFDVERGERYGGNIRAYVARKESRRAQREPSDCAGGRRAACAGGARRAAYPAGLERLPFACPCQSRQVPGLRLPGAS